MKKMLCIILCAAMCACAGINEKKKLTLISYNTPVFDDSYVQLAWEGFASVSTEADVSFMESSNQKEFEKNLKLVMDGGADLIFAPTFTALESVSIEAQEHPDISFVVGDAVIDTSIPNLTGISFAVAEASFLAGYIAANMAQSGKIGFVGGMDVSAIHPFLRGYEQGAKYADKDIEVLTRYIGTFIDSSLARSAAEELFAQGADVIFHSAGAAGHGVIYAAAAQGKWAIGVDEDQTRLAPANVLTCVVKNIDTAVASLMQDYLNGRTIGGINFEYGLNEGGVGLAKNNGNVPGELYIEAMEIAEMIQRGEITAE
ncbi:MAG: BMP family ABC transporter substrate-binding protein [Clostridia bacterium]|nr:BMP family ABC transporter substrate-binding protein [Clostridia bacterium]